jgi:anti-anti-sigma factor
MPLHPEDGTRASSGAVLQFHRAAQRDTWVLTLSGEHDLATVPELNGHMEDALRSDAPVVIDLTAATFLDCQVIGWLARWSQRAAERDQVQPAVVVGADGSAAARLFDVLDIAESIPITCVATKAEALDVVAPDGGPVPPSDPSVP